MNFKDLFAGGFQDETYSQGVRRRIRSGAIIWALGLVSLALTYGVYLFSGSAWATASSAALFGFASSLADMRIDAVRGDKPERSDKLIWLILFIPAMIGLAAASIFVLIRGSGGLSVLQAGLAAWLFGSVLGYTTRMLTGLQTVGWKS